MGTDQLSGPDCIVLLVIATVLSCRGLFAEDAATEQTPGDTLREIDVRIEADPNGTLISPYLASANCHGLKRHCVPSDAWDRTMRRMFGGNLLVLLQGAYKQPDAEGNWWNFEDIDTFIRKAKTVWRVKELAFLPQWWIREWDGKTEPTSEQFETSSQALVQLVKRYGVSGPLFVRYWMACDEWSGAKYWTANPDKFAQYYSKLVHEIKAVNPDLLVGGPVDAWPSRAIIRALLKQCPELDFIAWNLFICGSADMPIAKVFARTGKLRQEVERSQQLSREILGRELPVMVSSYNMNFRAWDPPDFRIAGSIGGVWNALALAYQAQANAFSAVMYNVLAKDCGMFGPRDGYAVRAGILPKSLDPELITVRPLAHVHEFFKRNIAGARTSRTEVDGDVEQFAVLGACDAQDRHAIVLVNFSTETRRVRLSVSPFEMASYSEFDLPTEHLYCDQSGIRRGSGLLFSPEGRATLLMPSYSAWCLKLRSAK